MVQIGSGAEKLLIDYALTRSASAITQPYLIAIYNATEIGCVLKAVNLGEDTRILWQLLPVG